MKYSTFCTAALIFLCSSIVTAAETKIYHWIDEDGNSHFSDTAVPGTEEVTVKNENLFSSDTALKTDSEDNDLSLDDEFADSEPAVEYQATITSPQDDMALRSNDGTINVHVKTTPEKENTQKLQLYLDGKALGSPQISPTMSARNIDRGTHQVQVHLLDEKGNVLAKTQIVTVHLQRATVGVLKANIN
ncbi:DUF4124 domain-containing protein [Psychromonas aquimarina]|uniref:DUF4124 domain-containing protein n=1 Tax=Psychromonas aquimarina TaxID=444919 RepID=UPI0003FFFC84|nr:DUF4124 domain-containing protein [Psychromonas aquimarina]